MFKSIILVASLVASATAQSIKIGYPAEGATVKSGSNITVMVERPNSLTGSTEVAVVIGMQSCVSDICKKFAPTDYLGSLLHHTGNYTPQYNADKTLYYQPPHQNFTVTVPSFLTKGAARLSVTHYSLVGASLDALFETKSVNVTIN